MNFLSSDFDSIYLQHDCEKKNTVTKDEYLKLKGAKMIGAMLVLIPFGILSLIWVQRSPKSFVQVWYLCSWALLFLTFFIAPYSIELLNIPSRFRPLMLVYENIIGASLMIVAVSGIITSSLFKWSAKQLSTTVMMQPKQSLDVLTEDEKQRFAIEEAKRQSKESR